MKKKLGAILLVVALVLALAIPTAVSADGPPTIDGVLSSGEWDSYYLGTSVTNWGGGTSVDVYGFADDTYLYAAYEADTTELGWALARALSINANLYYKTPQSASWPDSGYTILEMVYPRVMQTDGSNWVDIGSLPGNGITYWFNDMYNPTGTWNIAEFQIPLSLLTYAGTDRTIRLSGQYWQYDWATPFFVTLPPPEPIEVEIDIKPCSDPNSINLRSKGVVPVAVLTTPEFDATTVDPTTVMLMGSLDGIAFPVKWEIVDVLEFEAWDDDLQIYVCVGDGDLDLLLYFSTPELVFILDVGATEVTLKGQTFGLIPIGGTDSVLIVTKGPKGPP